MQTDKSNCSKTHKRNTSNYRNWSTAYLFVAKLADGGLVQAVTRPDGQIGIGLTPLGREAMTSIGEDGDHADDFTT